MQAPIQVPLFYQTLFLLLGPALVLALQVSNNLDNAKDKNILKALLNAGYVILSIIKLIITLR